MQVRAILAAKGRDVVTIEPDARVMEAANLMRRVDIGALVVADAHGAMLGMLTEREITRGLANCSYRLIDMRVAQIMSRTVVTCGPEDDVTTAMALMTHRRTRHIPVVDNGRLCGIVSLGDVVKSRLDDVELEVRVLRDLHLAHWGA
jgi:CBS domain-containing protein